MTIERDVFLLPWPWLALLVINAILLFLIILKMQRVDREKNPGTYMALCAVGFPFGFLGGIGFYGFLITGLYHVARWITG